MANNKREQLHTPIGVFKYCHLNKPDTKWKPEGEFKVTMLMDKEEPSTVALMAKLDALADAALEAAQEKFNETKGKTLANWKKSGITEPVRHEPYEDDYDEEGDPTGNIVMTFKTRASFEDKKGETVKKTVKLVDGKGQVIPSSKRPLVYGGTEGRVAFSTGNVFIALNADSYLGLYLNEAQITKLVSGGGNSSSFGAVEDSEFSADELEEYESKAKDEDDAGASDAVDDDLDDEIPF